MVLPLEDQNVLSHLELVVGQFAVAKSLSLCLFVVQRKVYKVPIRTHLRYPFLDLVSIVTFQPDLVNVWNVKPEVMVILEIQAEGAQLRLGSVPHSSAAGWP